MKTHDNLIERINQIANNITNYIETTKQKTTITSWDLKMQFKISSSLLYLTLGYLIAKGKIKITPENLIYKIELDTTNKELNNTSSDAKDPSH
ncbi:MAG: hypothetical protein N2Z20_03755 [Elusimicrobiales bacterium]|nr:hypothetical protein [Elusimicrobiales bacterium]